MHDKISVLKSVVKARRFTRLNPIEDVCSHDKRRAMRDGNRVEIKAHTSQAATMIAAKVWGQLTKCPFENACSAIVCYY